MATWWSPPAAVSAGDQPGWTTAYDHKVAVAAGRVLPVRRVALVDRALVVFIRW
jgi:hypothetical protein